MGISRLVVKWGNLERKAARKAILEVLANKTDSRAKLKAAGLIEDGAWREFEHENPTTQKHEHIFPTTLNVNFVKSETPR